MSKQKITFAFIFAVSLSGCNTQSNTDTASLSRFQNASLLENCLLKQKTESKSDQKYTSALVTSRNPSDQEIIMIGHLISKEIGSDSNKFTKYKEMLNSQIFLKVSSIQLNTTDSSNKPTTQTCNYFYPTNLTGELRKLPYLISTTNNTNTTPSNDINYIQPISVKDYAIGYFFNGNGVSYVNLSSSNTYKTQSNSQAISKLSNLIIGNMYSSEKFQDQPLHLTQVTEIKEVNSASALAEQATKGLKMPEYIPQNNINIASITQATTTAKIGSFEASDLNEKKMAEYNKNRYVDANTGINIKNDVLAKMKKEFGVDTSNLKQLLEIKDNGSPSESRNQE